MRICALILIAAAACTTRDPDPEFYGRPWVITAISANVPSGQQWDPDDSAPDPYAQFYLDGTLSAPRPPTTTPTARSGAPRSHRP